MEKILILFTLIPLIGFFTSVFLPDKRENLISRTAFGIMGVQLIALIGFIGYWLFHGHPDLDFKEVVLLEKEDFKFMIDLYFDKVTAAYALIGSFLTFLVTIYSRLYLHRESGYKRFFNSMLFFYLGYNLTIFAGNIETLLIGWEILGMSSFLLIAFYRNRYLPVKNALKVFTIYRIGDVGLILAMWMSHHLFHSSINFIELHNSTAVSAEIHSHSTMVLFICVMVLITAAAKSAQLPFSSWLPRAMEGPTPSSAIFYGSLSVHLGVFILLRFYPFWADMISIRILIALLGISTSIVTSLIARVQSSVKSQIAYSSTSQIGLIFVEVAAGFDNLALIHFAGNAFLRTYQLLVSPSVVSYLIREQFYNFMPRPQTLEDTWPKKIANSFYILSIKEWNLDSVIGLFFWNPLKTIGKKIKIPNLKTLLIFAIPVYVIGVFLVFSREHLSEQTYEILAIIFSTQALIMVLKSFTERKHVTLAWSLIIISHFINALAISLNEAGELYESLLYLTSIVLSGVLGYIVLYQLKRKEKRVDLNQFQGHSYEHPRMALIFLIACLGLAGFPITPTFIAEDLFFNHIHQSQVFLAFFTSLSFIITGISLLRMYARLFLGPHSKPYHEIPFKSS